MNLTHELERITLILREKEVTLAEVSDRLRKVNSGFEERQN